MKTQEQKQAAWRPTQEDYEQKYKEALEIASRKHKIMVEQDSTLAAGLLEEIFPELAESEDEKIRKAIIELLKEIGRDDTGISENVKIMIVWLEKQKESIHIPKTCKENPDSFTDEWTRKELVNFILYKVGHLLDEETEHRFVAYLKKQKEKPVEGEGLVDG